MLIPPRSESSSFGPDELKAIGIAFDHAVRRVRMGDRADVARAIIEAAITGERNPRRLCEAALKALTRSAAEA
jgi:uncharacterized protein YfeS